MTLSVASRYALRSLRRNLRRSALSVVGVAVGVGLGLLAFAWIRGEETMSINAAAGGGVGHLRVAPDGWVARRDEGLRLTDWEETLRAVRETEGVEVATPRARAGGLLGLGTRSAHVTLTGVDAATEPRALRYVSELAEGRYLAPGASGEVVIGRTIADRLDARLDDELVVTAVDDEGQMQSRLLRVVGVAETGSRDIDATIAHVALSDVERLSGREGAGEITILAEDVYALDAVQARVARHVAGDDALLTWLEVSPELRMNLESDGAFFDMAVMIILLVVLLGVASAQLTGVLERRKEFAVLAAVGMRTRALVKIVLVEGFVLGLGSAAAALLWAGPLIWWMNDAGVDLTAAMATSDEGIAFGGLLMDPIFHPDFGAWMLPSALALALVATIAASLYPAWFASRTDPANALRVDR